MFVSILLIYQIIIVNKFLSKIVWWINVNNIDLFLVCII